MRIEHLKYLVDVAETGSISQAADRLYISQQGLSQAIRQLEKQLGATLLNRSGNRIALTDLGWKTAEKSKEVLSKYDELLEIIAASAEVKNEERLVLFTTPYISVTVLPEIVNKYLYNHPQVDLIIHEHYPEEIIAGLSNDPEAIGLFSAPDYKIATFPFAEHHLQFDPFFYSDMMVLVAKNSPLAKKAILSVADIASYPLALYDFRPNVEMTKKIFEPVGKMNVVLKTANKNLIREMVASGKAIAIFSDFYELFERKDTVISVKLDVPFKFVLGWVQSQKRSPNPLLLDFISEMNKCVKKIVAKQ